MATSGSILGNPVLRREDPGSSPATRSTSTTSRFAGLLHVAFVRSTIAHAAIDGDRHQRRGVDAGRRRGLHGDDLDLPDYHGFVMLPPTMNRPPLATRQGALRRRHRRGGRRRDEGAGGRRGRSGDRRLRPAARGRRPRSRARRRRARACTRRRVRTSPTRWGPARSKACSTTPTSSCRARIVNQRVAPVPMEPAGIVAVPGEPAGGLTFWVATQGPHGVRDELAMHARPRSRGRPRRATPRSAAASAPRQGMIVEYLLVAQGRARARPAGEVDRDPLREHGRDVARPRPGPRRRAGPEARRHDHRAARAHDRRRRRVPGDRRVPAVLHADDGAERVRRSRRSSSTGRPRSRTPRRSPRTAARAGPRRSTSSSASSTSPPTSSASTRSRSGARTSSRPRRSRSRRSPASARRTTPASTTKALDAALEHAGYDALRAEQADAPRARRHASCSASASRRTSRSPRRSAFNRGVRRGRDRGRRHGHRARRHERARPGPRDRVRA